MSEYQYYEFLAIDRPLDDRALAEVRATSTRARITPTSFVNEYHFGDFKGNPNRLVENYFDAHLYVSNFRHQRFVVRVPRQAVDAKALMAYASGGVLAIRNVGEHVLIDFDTNLDEIDEDGAQEGEGWMSSLIPLREEVISGDLRPLYLGWLSAVHHGLLEDDETEPPIASGLRSLTAAQTALVEFLCLDRDLLEEAATASDEAQASVFDRKALERWIAGLPAHQKDELLLRHLAGDEPQLRARMLATFRQGLAPRHTAPEAPSRTVGPLLIAAEARAEERIRKESERADSERRQRAEEAARQRSAYLEGLSSRVEETWQQIEELILSRAPQSYDQAVTLLTDLKDLARGAQTLAAYSSRLQLMVTRHSRKVTLVQRIRSGGLLDEAPATRR